MRMVMLALAAVIVIALIRVYRGVDIDSVLLALGHLSWWHVVVLTGLLLVRQLLNAAPLAIYIPGVTYARAVVNDLAAGTASAFAPPPSDMVLRVAMFTSWGVPLPTALAGTTMNALTFFIVRFGTPLVGFALLPFTGQSLGLRALDLLSLAVCAVLVIGLLLIVRSGAQAEAMGRTLGGLARRARGTVDPDGWAASFRAFQHVIAGGFARKFPMALLSTAGMVLADLLILVTALRIVGLSETTLPLVVIGTAFLLAYPLTLFPMQGAGVVDAALLVSIIDFAGEGIKEAAVAALLIWRVVTIAGPFLLGAGAVVLWRSFMRRRRPADNAVPPGDAK